MKAERWLPLLVLVAGVAALVSVYRQHTQHRPVPTEFAQQPGPRLFFEHDCVSCHTVSSLPGARGTLGPGLDDVGTRARQLDPKGDGKAYLRESLLEPAKVVREGFVNAMPSFEGQLSESDLEALVEWLDTLQVRKDSP